MQQKTKTRKADGPAAAMPRAKAGLDSMALEESPQEMRRILREAAWSRMFGKSSTKNPFAR